MALIRLADGIALNTGGRYRVIKLADGCYIVGQGHFAPVTDREEGEILWSRLTKARKNERGGRLIPIGEPDVCNKRLERRLPDGRPPIIREYRVHASEQALFKDVHFLQGGEYGPPIRRDDTEYFYVKVQIPYRSLEEARTTERRVANEEKSVKTLMEILLNTRQFGYFVCPKCEGYGSTEIESSHGCTSCGGLAVILNHSIS